jgi:esterase/lipase
LIIHGFNGNPDELGYLNKYLQEKGFDTRTVLLAGHGDTKKALRKSSHTSWIGSAEAAVKELTQEYEHINLIGFSMGGLICANLASMPGIDKIVFINTPIYFWNLKIILNDVVKSVFNRNFEKIAYYKKSVLGVSVKSSVDFLRILAKSKQAFKNIQNQSLIIQCKNDESVHFKSAGYIKKKIGDNAELKYYNGGCHQVFDDIALRDLVCGDIHTFLIDPKE